MKPLLVLTLSEEHESSLRVLRLWNKDAPVVSSSFPVQKDMGQTLLEGRFGAIQDAGKVLSPLSGGIWPATEDEALKLICGEPSDLVAWRRRLHVLLALTGNLVFAADDKLGGSQDLLTTLVVARIIRAKSLGVIPLGVLPVAVPVTVLAAADLILSGEADVALASRCLVSLTQED